MNKELIRARQEAETLKNKLIKKGLLKSTSTNPCPLRAVAIKKKLSIEKRNKICLRCIFPECVLSSRRSNSAIKTIFRNITLQCYRCKSLETVQISDKGKLRETSRFKQKGKVIYHICGECKLLK